MDIEKLIERMNNHLQSLAAYSDPELAHTLEDAATAITGLLARAEAAEARAEKAERERDAAVSDLESIMAYNKDTCQFCKNGQCYIRGGTKPCLPKWRGQKED